MKLEEWATEEQASLWHDLDKAIREAVNGAWSMRAADCARRIAAVARLIGPTPIDSVPWALSAGDVYSTLLEISGVPVEPRSEAEWKEGEELMCKHGYPTLLQARAMYARTRAAMSTEREARFIRDGDE